MLGRGDCVHNNIGRAAHSAPTKLENRSIATRVSTEAVSRLFIRPDVDELFPCDTVNIISAIIKSKYEKPWLKWAKIPHNVKQMWYEEFKIYCKWDYEDDEEIVHIWKRKSAKIVREMIVAEELHRRMDVLEKQNERLRSEMGFLRSFLKKLKDERKGTNEHKCNETDVGGD